MILTAVGKNPELPFSEGGPLKSFKDKTSKTVMPERSDQTGPGGKAC